jgi:four helix bundle protein
MKNKQAYTNLSVWKDSLELVKSIYVLTSVFPEDEAKTLIDQLKSRAIEVPMGIANAMTTNNINDRRGYLAISHQKLTELETLFTIANKLNFISESDVDKFNSNSQNIGMQINGLIMKFKPLDQKKSEF